MEICSSVRLARSGGRSARGVWEVDSTGVGWDEDEGGSASVLSDMAVCQQNLLERGGIIII